jgi:LysR family transcriptional regulator, cell division regulator
MDAADLRIFEAVARLGSMSHAAAELNTVQSNVTARIRALEVDLGVKLFARHSRGTVLTDAGHRLLPYARQMTELLADARRAVQDDGTPRGPLVVGSLETTLALRLSPLLARFAAQHPGVDLVLRTGTTAELIGKVLARELDGAFVCGPVSHPDLIEEALFQEELVLATPASMPGPSSLEQLGEARIVVLRAGCSYRQRLEEILARRGVTQVRLLEFGTIEAILACVSAGLGVTLMPRGVVAGARVEGLALHALPPAEAQVTTVFIRHRAGFAPSAMEAFLEHVRPKPVALEEAREARRTPQRQGK